VTVGNQRRTANEDRVISVSVPFAFEFQLMFRNIKKYCIHFQFRGTEELTLSISQRTLSSTSLIPLQMQSHTTCFNDRLNVVSQQDNYLHKKKKSLGHFLT